MKIFSAVLLLFVIVTSFGCSDNETNPEPHVDPSIVKGCLIVRFASNFSITKTVTIPLSSFEVAYPNFHSKLVNINTVEVKSLLPHRLLNPELYYLPNDTSDLVSFYMISFDTNKNVVIAYEYLKSDPIIKSVSFNHYIYIDDLVKNPNSKNPTPVRKKLSLTEGKAILKRVE